MPLKARKIKRKIDGMVKRADVEWSQTVAAETGKDDSGLVQTGKDGMIWVRLRNGEPREVYNDIAPDEPFIKVLIGKKKEQPALWRVVAVRDAYSVPQAPRVKHHHEQHEFGGPDMLPVNRKQIMALTAIVSDGAAFIVMVYGGIFRGATGKVRVDSQPVDLSSYVPASGAVYVDIEADSDGVLSVNEGTGFASPAVATVSDLPTTTAGKYWICTALLFEGMEELLNEHILVPFPVSTDYSLFGSINLDDLLDVNAPTPADTQVLTWDDGAGEWVAADATGGSPDWGDIGGTLSDQTDLQAELDAKADLTYVDALIAANDAMVYKGVIDCSANTNYPAADAGHAYKISVAGKIGGASGLNVEVGDLILCITDGSASGNQATVGANWDVIQVNIDGAVIGPASSTSGNIATFNGTSGKVVQDGGATVASLGTAAQILNAVAEDEEFENTDLLTARRADGTLIKIFWGTVISQLLAIMESLFAFLDHAHDGVDGTSVLAQANTHESPDTDSGISSLHHTLGGNATQAAPGNGWIPGTGTWSYTSADSPIFVASVPDADAALINVGNKIKLTQTTVKYFIVHAKGSPSGGFTPVTIYGGTDYTLANAAITSPFFSHEQSPLAFPMDPAKWTVVATDTSLRTQNNPTSGTWYNLGSVTIAAPIGVWRTIVTVLPSADRAAAGLLNVFVTLSTANNSESDASMTRKMSVSNTTLIEGSQVAERILGLAAKTSYFLNTKQQTSGAISNIYNDGSKQTTTIQLIDAYL